MKHIMNMHGNYLITTDKSLLKPAEVHKWLSNKAYWSKGIPYDLVKSAFDHSFCIGALHEGKQVSYARLITDYTTFAYLADVYVAEEHRGKGISKKMMELIMELPWVQRLRRFMLATLDAHQLYEQFGFAQPGHPERLMEINRPAVYGDKENLCS